MTASTSMIWNRPTWFWSACRARRRRRPRSISPTAASRPATSRWCPDVPVPPQLEKLAQPLVVGLYCQPGTHRADPAEPAAGTAGPAGCRSIHRSPGGGRGDRLFARKLCGKHNWPMIDVTPPLDRGNRRRGDDAAGGAPRAGNRPAEWRMPMALWLDAQTAGAGFEERADGARCCEAAGLPIEVVAADDRRTRDRSRRPDAAIRPRWRGSAGAREGAAVRGQRPGRLVLGADQTLALGQRRFSKAADRAAARGAAAGAARPDPRAAFRHCDRARRRP